MTPADIFKLRLKNQQITGTKFKDPWEIVAHMGAMQSQDFNMAKWAIGLRLPGVKEWTIEKDFNEGKILRTHVLRPTWHFVSPENIRWLIELTAPHVQHQNSYMRKKLEITTSMLTRSLDIIGRCLMDKKQLTRDEINEELGKKKIRVDGIRLVYLLMNAELEQLICSGGRKGKQFTYALLDDQAPQQKKLTEEEALSKIGQLFFSTRGPATIHDLAYWSGLSIAKSSRAADMLSGDFTTAEVEGKKYYFISDDVSGSWPVRSTFLLPDYDEYGMSYKDKKLLMGGLEKMPVLAGPLINHMLVIDGRFGGFWRKVKTGEEIRIVTEFFKKASAAQNKKVTQALRNYLRYLML